MPISQKIIDRVSATSTTPEEQALMMQILQIEDKGIFRFETAYEKVIKDFIVARDKEAGEDWWELLLIK